MDEMVKEITILFPSDKFPDGVKALQEAESLRKQLVNPSGSFTLNSDVRTGDDGVRVILWKEQDGSRIEIFPWVVNFIKRPADFVKPYLERGARFI